MAEDRCTVVELDAKDLQRSASSSASLGRLLQDGWTIQATLIVEKAGEQILQCLLSPPAPPKYGRLAGWVGVGCALGSFVGSLPLLLTVWG